MTLRNWQRYFNDRYQTYSRFVHFYVYYATGTHWTPEGRRADAAEELRQGAPVRRDVVRQPGKRGTST